MKDLTRKSFIKALVATTALSATAGGLILKSGNAKDSLPQRISAAHTSHLKGKYRLTPVQGAPGTFDFFIGEKRYRLGFISKICLGGLAFATKERYRSIFSFPQKATPVPPDIHTSLEAIRMYGTWQYPIGSRFPRDFPLSDLAAAADAEDEAKNAHLQGNLMSFTKEKLETKKKEHTANA